MKLNRRDFLRTSAAATFALGSLPLVGAQTQAKQYRTAIIGTGWWGMNILGEAMASGRSRVVAMCDVDERLLQPAWEKVKKLTGAEPQRYRDYRELLEREKPEICIVATPDHWWGSFFYNEKNDAVRFTVNPITSEFQEWLFYSFDVLSANSTTLSLKWEKLAIPIRIEIDVNVTVIASMEKELTGIPGFFWQGWNQIALYALTNNYNLEKASTWVERSIGINKNLTNLMTKSLILENKGKSEEAEKIKKEAFALPGIDEAQVNALGYQLMGIGKTEEALKVFEKNTVDHPDSWNTWISRAATSSSWLRIICSSRF